MNLSFWKYQGTGNDFVMLDNRVQKLENILTKKHISFLCNRRMGIGADGLILLSDSGKYDFNMIYYNADGGESTMCGNGGRCLVAFAHARGIVKERYTFEAIDGLHHADYQEGIVDLEMIAPHSYRKLDDSSSWIHTGSPHYVGFEDDSLEQFDVYTKGKSIRYDSRFSKGGGTNANFVNILEPGHLRVRTYERGVEDETLSCGTGVTACAYIYKLEQARDLEEIKIETEGGQLSVRIHDDKAGHETVILSGPATFVYKGNIQF
ncbi:MAG: diaminopimelate epimerase [Bacteroidota bacterium]